MVGAGFTNHLRQKLIIPINPPSTVNLNVDFFHLIKVKVDIGY